VPWFATPVTKGLGHTSAACFLRPAYYIGSMPTLIAGIVAVILLYSLLQIVSRGQSHRSGPRDQIGGGVGGAGGRSLYRHQGRACGAVPLGIFGAGLLGWSPFGASGFGFW